MSYVTFGSQYYELVLCLSYSCAGNLKIQNSIYERNGSVTMQHVHEFCYAAIFKGQKLVCVCRAVPAVLVVGCSFYQIKCH